MIKKQVYKLLLLCLVCLFAASCAKDAVSRDDIVDVDLTALSSTVVYAEVYNIMMDPDSYVGKTIKGSGVYNSFYYEEMDRYFHYFIISDATGCCPQGLDFVWSGEHIYPDDYPDIGEDIEVTGVFIKGEIEGQPYYYIAVDDPEAKWID